MRDQFVSIDGYFALEERSPVRHEYVGGRMHAMSGVTRQHSQIVLNVGARLWAAARGGRCRVHLEAVKLRVGDNVYYPDTMVACGAPPRDQRIEDAPTSLVEVLSPSTERTVRGEKAVVYKGIPSLRAYVVIEQERRWVEHHWRHERGPWQHETLVDGGVVRFSHPAVALTLEEIYEGVEMPSPEEYSRRLRLREEAASYG
jgi:Uma2 family endonuclease